MVNIKNLVWRTSLLFLGMTFCSSLSAQQQVDRQRPREQEAVSYGVKETSDLAQDNLNRVAASAAQIRIVLARDEGLLVDLKRDRKSTRLNSSHSQISYAVFCLKK